MQVHTAITKLFFFMYIFQISFKFRFFKDTSAPFEPSLGWAFLYFPVYWDKAELYFSKKKNFQFFSSRRTPRGPFLAKLFARNGPAVRLKESKKRSFSLSFRRKKTVLLRTVPRFFSSTRYASCLRRKICFDSGGRSGVNSFTPDLPWSHVFL
jgi:hypothetical protein